MNRIRVLIDGRDTDDTFKDVNDAMTWAEMNSRPGQKLRVLFDHSWESPVDVDAGHYCIVAPGCIPLCGFESFTSACVYKSAHGTPGVVMFFDGKNYVPADECTSVEGLAS